MPLNKETKPKFKIFHYKMECYNKKTSQRIKKLIIAAEKNSIPKYENKLLNKRKKIAN